MSNTNDNEYLRYLDALRDSGQINMFGAAIPLREVYPELSETEARRVVIHWMETFAERHGDT